MPKVSICIPAYNQTKFLSRTLESILLQTFQDYELIVTDDSETNIVETLLATFDFDGRLLYYRNTPPLGSPKNWNFGIGKASGTYIKIMHHDDWFASPESLELFVEAIDSTGAAIVFTNAEIRYEDSQNRTFHAPGSNKLLKLKREPSKLFEGNFIGDPSMTMYRRDLSVLFDENMKWLVDVDFYIRILEKNNCFAYIDSFLLVVMTAVKNSVTTSCENDKAVVVRETFYLHGKLFKANKLFQGIKYFPLLMSLLDRFSISVFSEVVSVVGIANLPFFFEIYFRLTKQKRRLNYLVRKYFADAA